MRTFILAQTTIQYRGKEYGVQILRMGDSASGFRWPSNQCDATHCMYLKYPHGKCISLAYTVRAQHGP